MLKNSKVVKTKFRRAVSETGIPRLMKAGGISLRRKARQGVDYFHVTRQLGLNALRGRKQTHLLICGFSRSGSTMLYMMLKNSVSGDVFFPSREMKADITQGISSSGVCTKRPLDVFRLRDIRKALSFRDVKVLLVVRDPRDLLSSKHKGAPHQFFQGHDYMMFVSDVFSALTQPGIAETAKAIRGVMSDKDVMVVRYEELTKDPEGVKQLISDFSGLPITGVFGDFYKADVPADLRAPLNDQRPVDASTKPAWTLPGRIERVLDQYSAHPDLDEICASLGYPRLADVIGGAVVEGGDASSFGGTVVAFHTDDEIYTNEAKRFASRLDEISVNHHITTISAERDWVKNCAVKPRIVSDAREAIEGPILYCDVDAYFHTSPWRSLFEFRHCDVAAHITDQGELLSGTLLINDTEGARIALEEWNLEQNRNPAVWDQRTLQEVIRREEAKPLSEQRFVFHRLPANATYIFDRHRGFLAGSPIVEHLQVSREVKGERVATRRERLLDLFGEKG